MDWEFEAVQVERWSMLFAKKNCMIRLWKISMRKTLHKLFWTRNRLTLKIDFVLFFKWRSIRLHATINKIRFACLTE